MADSLKITDNIINATSLRKYGSTFTVTRTGTAEQHLRWDVGTTEESVAVSSDIGDLGVCQFTNHDATNYVEVGHGTGVYFTEVYPGESVRLRGPAATTAFYVKADTAACDFEMDLFEK